MYQALMKAFWSYDAAAAAIVVGVWGLALLVIWLVNRREDRVLQRELQGVLKRFDEEATTGRGKEGPL